MILATASHFINETRQFRCGLNLELTIRRSLPVFVSEQTFVNRADRSVPGHKPTSLERPETNTLSVGAHPRDGESVEAKGMPKVK